MLKNRMGERRRRIRTRQLPNWALRVAAWFNPLAREILPEPARGRAHPTKAKAAARLAAAVERGGDNRRRPEPGQGSAVVVSSIDAVIEQRRRDLGGFQVGRVLPAPAIDGRVRSFSSIISDPLNSPAGIPRSVDVRPHPHIGLSDGDLSFRRRNHASRQPALGAADSSGEVNLDDRRTAASRIRRGSSARAPRAVTLHGLQRGCALPKSRGGRDPFLAPRSS